MRRPHRVHGPRGRPVQRAIHPRVVRYGFVFSPPSPYPPSGLGLGPAHPAPDDTAVIGVDAGRAVKHPQMYVRTMFGRHESESETT